MARSYRKYLWKQDRWYGGQSDDSRTGPAGSARYLLGWDIHDDSGLLKVGAKPVKDSSTVITKLVTWMDINPTTSDMYHYAEDTIYKEASGTYTSVHTLTGDSPNGQGMCDFNLYLYYMRDTILGRFNYDATWTDSWQTGLTSARWHPMYRFKNLMLIGHGRYVATVDDVGTFTLARLTLPVGYYVRQFFKVGTYVAILATKGQNITDSEDGFLFLWNGSSETYDDYKPITGNPHAGMAMNNKMVIIAGNPATIQESLGGEFKVIQQIPDIGIGKTAEVYPGAIDVWRGLIHFAISAGTSTTVLRTVNSWGVKNAKFEQVTGSVLNPAYPISTGTLAGTGMQITAVKKIGTTLRYAWKDSTTYGVDEIDTTLLQASATWRSLSFDRQSPYEKVADRLIIELAGALNTDETVEAKVSVEPYDDPTFIDTTSYVTGTLSTAGKKRLEVPLVVSGVPIRSADLHIEITSGGTAATKPTIKRAWIQITEDDDNI